MKVLSFIFLGMLLFCVTGCRFSQPLMDILTPSPDQLPVNPQDVFHSDELTALIQNYTTELKYQKRLHLEHANTYFKDGISLVQLEFISQDIIEMCEARELIIDVTEGLLGKLNQNPILGGAFATFPFRPSNIEIYITFESWFGKYCDPHYIAWIGLEDAQVTYYEFDLLDHMKACWHARHESYATSREIVVYQRQAEKQYSEEHITNWTVIFGPHRYFPPGTK
jgi:hypothetical protein